MRTVVGIAGVTVLFALAGHGVLLAAGLTRLRLRTLLSATGLAYMAGVAATMLLGIVFLTLGGELSLPAFVILALLVCGAGVALELRRGRAAGVQRGAEPVAPEARVVASRPEKVVIGVGIALLVAILVAGLVAAGVRPLAEWDGWSIWTRKAVVLASSGLDERLFGGLPYAFMHPDYPVLLPLFESLHFRAMGVADGQAIHAALWILLLATLGSVAYLGSRFARIWVWLPVVLALAFGSTFAGQLMTAYADVPLALFAIPGVLCLGLWLRDLDWRYLALGCLLLGAVANVKNEGVLLMVAAFVAAALVLAVGRVWPALIRLGLGFGALLVVAVVPWHVWTAANDIKSNLPISKGLDPGYLSDRSDRIVPSFKALYPMLESGGLSYVVPLAVALVLVGLATAGLRRVAAFYLLAGLGTLFSVVWAFVITNDTLAYQISTSASRVVMGVTAVGVAALLQLGGLLDSEREATPA
jgi:hypothetical protein